jgi:hypothetical protein
MLRRAGVAGWQPVAMNTQAKREVRRAVVAVTISSFTIAALMGIGALLGAGDFGETEVRILLTTVLMGSTSVLTLCCLVVVGKRFEAVGVIGFLVILAATALGLLLVWGSGPDDLGDTVFETFGVASVMSVTLAQVCLLLGLAGARRPLRYLLWATIGLALLLAAQVSALIFEYQPGDGYARFLGVVAILDVLGTLVTIAVSVFGSDDESLTVTLPAMVSARLRSQADQTGRPVRDLVDEAVARYLGLPVD